MNENTNQSDFKAVALIVICLLVAIAIGSFLASCKPLHPLQMESASASELEAIDSTLTK